MLLALSSLLIAIAEPGPCEPRRPLSEPILIGPSIGETLIPRNTWIWLIEGAVPFTLGSITDRESGAPIAVEVHRFEFNDGASIALEPMASLDANRRYRFDIQGSEVDFTTGADEDHQAPPSPLVKTVATVEGTEVCAFPELRIDVTGLEVGAIAVPTITVTVYDPPYVTHGIIARSQTMVMNLPAREDDMEVQVTAYDLAGNASALSEAEVVSVSDEGDCSCSSTRSRGSSSFVGVALLALLLARRRRS